MKRILFILLLTIPFIGFGQTEYVKEYHKNGQLEYEGNFKDGKREGLWKYYYSTGQLEWEGNFKDGKEEGLFKIYYENGQLMMEGNYKDGKREGLSKEYYKNGQLKWEGNFKDEELISKKCWDEKGNEIDCED